MEHQFRGYIHLKTIPEADQELIAEAGLHADRLSINIELPSETSLKAYAPEKSAPVIRSAMARVRSEIESRRPDRREKVRSRPPRFVPGGQSTQMIVGADSSSDQAIIRTSASLYSGYRLKRVYYSAFSPIQDSSADLPLVKPPLMREHRLYQADWLMRFYGFQNDEIFAGQKDGMLDLDIDPKLSWALVHRDLFPVDVNRASREELLRVPGFGTKTVARILTARRHSTLRLDHVGKIVRSLKVCRDFISASDWHPGRALDLTDLRDRFTPAPQQLALL